MAFFGSQAQGGQQPYLEIDVIGQPPERRADHPPDGPQGQSQKD